MAEPPRAPDLYGVVTQTDPGATAGQLGLWDGPAAGVDDRRDAQITATLLAAYKASICHDAGEVAPGVGTEAALIRVAAALGAAGVTGWTPVEAAVLRAAVAATPAPDSATLAYFRDGVRAGADPLGDAFMALRSADVRRPDGATYTPSAIVEVMLDWAADRARVAGAPARIIDPGAGSARYLVAAARRFPSSALVGVELDPVAAILARAHLAAAGHGARARILLADYRAAELGPAGGSALYIGNPPYVRHHHISPTWKAWLVAEAGRLGLTASQLAGLHVYFFLRVARTARPGDAGAFVTSAEWLDVNYGRLVRDLFVGPLGGRDLLVLDPAVRAFPDAATTAAITTFVVGERSPAVRLSRVAALSELATPGVLGAGHDTHRERLAAAPRWTPLLLAAREVREGYVELGELCRVHRGAVTGANRVWIADADVDLPPEVLFASVTRARELFAAGPVLADPRSLKRVIDLPVDLDVFDGAARRAVARFLRRAKQRGAADGYIAQHRARWWAIGLRQAPPILATYMARRPPAFVRNTAGARYINVAHGLYPRGPLGDAALRGLAAYLARTTTLDSGRTYAGGLTKFEPREMERLLVPAPEQLAAEAGPDDPAATLDDRLPA